MKSRQQPPLHPPSSTVAHSAHSEDANAPELPLDDRDRISVSDLSKLHYELNHSLMMEIFSRPKNVAVKSEEVLTAERKELEMCKKELVELIRKETEEVEELQKTINLGNK